MAAVVVNRPALRAFFDNPIGPVNLHLRSLASDTADSARSRIRRSARTDRPPGPHLADSLSLSTQRSPGGGHDWFVTADRPYAMVHHEGARPHRIFPRGKALFFHWDRFGVDTIVPAGGQFRTYFSRSMQLLVIGKGRIDHPGHAANRYLLSALQEIVGR